VLLLSQRRSLNTLPSPVSLPPQIDSIGGLSNHSVREVLHHIYVRLDQVFVPGRGNFQNQNAMALMRRIVSESLFANIFVFTQLVRELAIKAQSSPEQERARFRCLAEAIQIVNHRLRDHDTAIDDDTILAVLALSFHDPKLDEQKAPLGSIQFQKPSQGPLKSLRMLQLYGGPIKHASMHLRGLVKMIELRGGLSSLHMPGLAQNVA
jgi:hypothetical protein